MKKRLLIPIALVALGGCSSELDELKQFVRESDKGLPRKIEVTCNKRLAAARRAMRSCRRVPVVASVRWLLRGDDGVVSADRGSR